MLSRLASVVRGSQCTCNTSTEAMAPVTCCSGLFSIGGSYLLGFLALADFHGTRGVSWGWNKTPLGGLNLHAGNTKWLCSNIVSNYLEIDYEIGDV